MAFKPSKASQAPAPAPAPEPTVHRPTLEDVNNLYGAVHRWEETLSPAVRAAGGWQAKKESALGVIRWLRTQIQ